MVTFKSNASISPFDCCSSQQLISNSPLVTEQIKPSVIWGEACKHHEVLLTTWVDIKYSQKLGVFSVEQHNLPWIFSLLESVDYALNSLWGWWRMFCLPWGSPFAQRLLPASCPLVGILKSESLCPPDKLFHLQIQIELTLLDIMKQKIARDIQQEGESHLPHTDNDLKPLRVFSLIFLLTSVCFLHST